jgi:hypothetical protein
MDRGMMIAMYSYGLKKVSSWLADARFPFHFSIPSTRLDAVRAAGRQEESTGLVSRPDLPSWHFLYNNLVRYRRVMAIATHLLAPVAVGASPAPGVRGIGLSTARDGGNSFQVLHHGLLTNASYAWQNAHGGPAIPVNYVSRLSRLDAAGKVHRYICTVNEAQNQLLFVVVLVDVPGEVYEGDSPDRVWKLVDERNFREGMGSMLFGFENPAIRQTINIMDQAYRVASRARHDVLHRVPTSVLSIATPSAQLGPLT